MPYYTFDNKKVHYRTIGEGSPLLMLPGNTTSSKLFSTIIKFYKKSFKVILIDFPGHGKSERVEILNSDFWYYNAQVTNALLEFLCIKRAFVVGTSGGALVGINLALEYPEKVIALIADSFEGEFPLKTYISSLKQDRENDKKKLFAKLFWFYNHGINWERVVDLDTKVNLDFFNSGKSFFHKNISELKVPTLLTGSKKDEYCNNLEQLYLSLQEKNRELKIHLFDSGNHPAMISNKEEFSELLKNFFLR